MIRNHFRDNHEMREAVCLGLANNVRRLAAGVEITNGPQHHAAGGDDRLVAGPEKLLSPVGNRTAAFHDGCILNVKDSPHARKAPGLHRFAILQIAVTPIANRFVVRCELIENLLVSLNVFFIHRCAATENDVIAPMVCVVDGHVQ